jgi:hypothetical protein
MYKCVNSIYEICRRETMLGHALESQLQERKTRQEIFLTLSLIETKIGP